MKVLACLMTKTKNLSSDFLEERQAKAFSLVQNFKCLFQILCVPGVIQQDGQSAVVSQTFPSRHGCVLCRHALAWC